MRLPAPTTLLRPPGARCNASSKKQWLARQSADVFVRQRQQGAAQGDPSSAFVSRSAFKLLEIHSSFGLRPSSGTIIDLGAAPGGWVQSLHSVRGRGSRGRIIGLDLLPLNNTVAGLPHVEFIQGDFLSPSVRRQLETKLKEDASGGVALVLSDMLANMTGNPTRDSQISLDLCETALGFALQHLSPTSHIKKPPVQLVMKALESGETAAFERDILRPAFSNIARFKPKSSRPESIEFYWVARGLFSEEERTKRSKRAGGKRMPEEQEPEGESDSLYF